MTRLLKVRIENLRPGLQSKTISKKNLTLKYGTFKVTSRIPRNPQTLEDSKVFGQFPELKKNDPHYGKTFLYKRDLILKEK